MKFPSLKVDPVNRSFDSAVSWLGNTILFLFVSVFVVIAAFLVVPWIWLCQALQELHNELY